jgi:hypothetical protein
VIDMTNPHEPVDSKSTSDDYRSGPVGPDQPPSASSRARHAAEGAPEPMHQGRTNRPATGGAHRGPAVAAGAGTPDPGPAPAIPAAANAWQAFGVFILSQHRILRFPALNRAMCSHGVQEHECQIRGMARQLGILPDP